MNIYPELMKTMKEAAKEAQKNTFEREVNDIACHIYALKVAMGCNLEKLMKEVNNRVLEYHKDLKDEEL